VGHRGAVIRPANCRYLNYEGQVAMVTGRTCRGIPRAVSGDDIAGYAIVFRGIRPPART
jgi:5-oxopent-3-ene-1,2,5-tricarboxylate decarboxylase / 2-hydroxyhepta-2,4-diene-1,7-dioate isomerase